MSEDTTPPGGGAPEDAPAEDASRSESRRDVPGEPGPHAESEAAQAAGPQSVPLAALPAPDLLTSFLSLMAMKAWEGMGLVPNPLEGKTQKNLDDARLAIDAYAAVFEVLRMRLDGESRREMENVLTMLRVNFVDKSAG